MIDLSVWRACLLIVACDNNGNMAEETIYLCKFRVSVDGDWLCLKELADVQLQELAVESPEDGGCGTGV